MVFTLRLIYFFNGDIITDFPDCVTENRVKRPLRLVEWGILLAVESRKVRNFAENRDFMKLMVTGEGIGPPLQIISFSAASWIR
jgi:hypothetical protein